MSTEQRISILEKQVALLTLRLSDLAVDSHVRAKPVTPKHVIDAYTEHAHELRGVMSGSQAAQTLGLHDDHSTLIAIGRHLSSIGIKRTRKPSGRFYVFDGVADSDLEESAPAGPERLPEWMAQLMQQKAHLLKGHMSAPAVLKALGIPEHAHTIERLHEHMRISGAEILEGGDVRFSLS